MNIGSLVIHAGRTYYLRGLDPMGVADRRADLEDAETGELLQVPLDAILPADPPQPTDPPPAA